MRDLDIADVAEKTGLAPSTLRYYEQLGLVRATGRNGLRRQYHPDVLDELAFVRLASLAGFTLKEIASMVRDGRYFVDRAMAERKVAELDAQIAEMTAIRQALQHVVACPKDDQFTCGRFKTLLRSAFRLTRRASQAP